MAKEFTKGEQVVYVGSWDRKGRVYARPAIVHSCGNKRMVLIDAATGIEMGNHFLPTRQQHGYDLVIRATENVEAIALEVGQIIIARETAHYDHCINVVGQTAGAAYIESCEKDKATMLTTPEFIGNPYAK